MRRSSTIRSRTSQSIRLMKLSPFGMYDSARKEVGSHVTKQLSRTRRHRATALHLFPPDPPLSPPTAKMFRTVPRMAGYVSLRSCNFFRRHSRSPRECEWISLRQPLGCLQSCNCNWHPGRRLLGLQNERRLLIRVLLLVSCSARTVSLTTSVCSRTTTASVSGGRSVRIDDPAP
jgi:hypothetical protein